MAIPAQSDPQFKLRIPAELKARIQSSAAASGRSMNAEIVATLELKYPPPSDDFDKLVVEPIIKVILSRVPRDVLVDDFEHQMRDVIRKALDDHPASLDQTTPQGRSLSDAPDEPAEPQKGRSLGKPDD